MKYTIAAATALFGLTLAQGVTQKITPTGAAPAGCTGSYSGNFQITVATAKSKREVALNQKNEKRQQSACGGSGTLVITLKDGVLTDSQNRIGYIAANRQFQFDGPPQTGAIYTAGWSICSNNFLALGSSTTFYQCLSGNFYNLYDRTQGGQCQPINIIISSCGGGGGSGNSTSMPASMSRPGVSTIGTSFKATTPVTQITDGQPQVKSTVVPVPMCQIMDGQIQVHTTPCASITAMPTSSGRPVSQITDGQIQASSARPVSQITDGQIQASSARPTSSARPVSQITDGQIQASSARPVSQITDGQIQASSARPTSAPSSVRPVSQITDGQIQASSARPVSQITDGQIQASSARPQTPSMSSGRPVSQITDGQIQASSARPVSQITDGQIQASRTTSPPPGPSNGTVATPTPSRVVTASANMVTASFGALAFSFVFLVAML